MINNDSELPQVAETFSLLRDRRAFLKASLCAFGACLTGLSLPSCGQLGRPCRKGSPNLFTSDGQPLLVVVTGQNLAASLQTGIEALGGFSKLTALGHDVVIKPNYVIGNPYPITTATDFLWAFTDALKMGGFSRMAVFEAPGSRLWTPLRPEANFEKFEVLQEAKKRGIEIIAGDPLARDEYCLVRSPSWASESPFGLNNRLRQAPIVISVPVLKRHAAAGLTCALKNHFGSVMMVDRLMAHKKMGQGGEHFDRRLVEFADAVRPELTVVDARSLLARNGPTHGDVVAGVNKLILSGDMVAIDAYCAQLLAEHDKTFAPEMIQGQLSYAVSLGLGVADLKGVKVIEVTS